MLTRGFFSSIEVVGRPPDRGRVILAASHLNGFVDPVVLVGRLGYLPRFLAKATLWKVLPARYLLDVARVIPVQRRADAGDATDNTSMFSRAIDALRHGSVVAVFPEGTTHDDPSIRPLRTGVARIALAASASGVDDVLIVPIGITYEDKVRVRGRALIHYGEPIPVPPASPAADGSVDDPDHEVVRALTDRLTEAIQDTTPDFETLEDAVGLTHAATIAVRPVDSDARPPSLARVEQVARDLSHAPRPDVDRVVDEVARYQMLLGSIRLRDEDVVADRRLLTVTRRTVWLTALLVLLAPFALAGVFANLPPTLLVLVAGLVPEAPVSKGTIRVLVGALAFPLTWLAIAVWDVGTGALSSVLQVVTLPLEPLFDAAFESRGGFWPGVLVFLACPVLGLVALLFVERLLALIRDWRVWQALLDRRGQLPAIRERRAAVVQAVADLGAVPPPAAPAPPVRRRPTPRSPRDRASRRRL